MAKSTLESYKKGVWEVFSLMIRARDANNEGYFKCCTCTRVVYWRGAESQAGHYVSGRGNSVLFDERLVHAQCYHCNQPLGGNIWQYTKFMKSKGYTEEQLDELHNLRHKVRKFTLGELKIMKQEFKAKLVASCTEKKLVLV